jgi:hypothetical protein
MPICIWLAGEVRGIAVEAGSGVRGTKGVTLEVLEALASDVRGRKSPVHLICPVGSEKFTGSPTQYVYAFNPPRPNGLQLSGL